MRPTRLWTKVRNGAALVAGFSILMFVGANAMTITVSPSAAGLSNAPNFSFDGIRTSNFSTINLNSVGGGSYSFSETGFLPIASFDSGNFTPPGLNRATGATAYGLYIAFAASGTLAAAGPGMLEGSFSSINYTLKGDPGFGDTFNHFNAQHQVFCVGCAGDFTLANGTLLPGGNDTAVIAKAGSTKPLPAAFVDLLFNATSASFFVSPGAPFSADLMTQFSNTSFVTNQYTTNLPAGVARVVTIGTMAGQGGAGSGQFANLPEPARLLILGSGLLCLGLIRRPPTARRRPSPELTLTTIPQGGPEGLRGSRRGRLTPRDVGRAARPGFYQCAARERGSRPNCRWGLSRPDCGSSCRRAKGDLGAPGRGDWGQQTESWRMRHALRQPRSDADCLRLRRWRKHADAGSAVVQRPADAKQGIGAGEARARVFANLSEREARRC